MSVAYKILIGGYDHPKLFNDAANVDKLQRWLKNNGWEYASFKKLTQGDGIAFWYCDYIKNLDQDVFKIMVKQLQWSDDFFLMISSNSDPFKLHIGDVDISLAIESI